jgi:hypothetical protein
MALTASDSGSGTRVLAPEGVHRAACIGLYDLGTQSGGQYGPKPKILIQWELIDEPMDDGRPFVVSQRYTLSLSEKSLLRPMLESWRGRAFTVEELKAFDLFTVLGKPCQVQVIHETSKTTGKTYDNVVAVMPLGKGTQPIKPSDIHNPIVRFAFEEQKPGSVTFPAGIQPWLQTLLENTPQYKELMSGQPATPQANGDGVTYDAVDDEADSCPF